MTSSNNNKQKLINNIFAKSLVVGGIACLGIGAASSFVSEKVQTRNLNRKLFSKLEIIEDDVQACCSNKNIKKVNAIGSNLNSEKSKPNKLLSSNLTNNQLEIDNLDRATIKDKQSSINQKEINNNKSQFEIDNSNKVVIKNKQTSINEREINNKKIATKRIIPFDSDLNIKINSGNLQGVNNNEVSLNTNIPLKTSSTHKTSLNIKAGVIGPDTSPDSKKPSINDFSTSIGASIDQQFINKNTTYGLSAGYTHKNLNLKKSQCTILPDGTQVSSYYCDKYGEEMDYFYRDTEKTVSLNNVNLTGYAINNRGGVGITHSVPTDKSVNKIGTSERTPKSNTALTAVLQLNGHDRFKQKEGSYFNYVQPVEYFVAGSVTDGVNAYSYALNPEEHQPSGTCNFSRIDNATSNLYMVGATCTSDECAVHAGVTIPLGKKKNKIFNENYNVLRIMSGMGGLAYSN